MSLYNSVVFDGSGDYLTVASDAAFGYGTGDFTVEFWLNPNDLTTAVLYDQRNGAGVSAAPTIYHSNGTLTFFASGGDRISGGSLTQGAWNHVALARASGSTKMFLNGIQVGSTYADSINYITSPVRIMAGNDGGALNEESGYISNFRIVKGTAVYTSNFAVPTAPLTAISGTSLLTAQSSTIVDNSGNNFTVTAVGNAAVSGEDPFGDGATTTTTSTTTSTTTTTTTINPNAVSARYIKWHITGNKGNSVTQGVEFLLWNNGSLVNWDPGVTITNPGGSDGGFPQHAVSKLIDRTGAPGSSPSWYGDGWIDFGFSSAGNNSTVIIDNQTALSFSDYSFVTRWDTENGDPDDWTVSISDDGTNWTVVSTVVNANITSSRLTETAQYPVAITTTTTTTTAAPTTTTTTEAPTTTTTTAAPTTTTTSTSTTTTTTTAAPTLFVDVNATDSASYPGTGTTWFDLSGFDRDLTLAGTFSHQVDGGFGYFDFNNTATATTPQISTFGNAFTVAGWVQPLTTFGSERTVLTVTGANGLFEFDLKIPENTLRSSFYYRTAESWRAGYNSAQQTGGAVYNSQWAHVVLVYEEFNSGLTPLGRMKVYINGQIVHFITLHLDYVRLGNGSLINAGARTNATIQLSGAEYVHSLTVENQLFSDADVLALYNAEVGDFPVLSTTTTTTLAPTTTTTTTTAAPTTTTSTTSTTTSTTSTTSSTTTTTTQSELRMATTIQIKRSSGVTAPTTAVLAEGELAYSQDRANEGAGAILYIESVAADGTTAVVDKVGGKYYTGTVDTFLVPKAAATAAALQLHEAGDNGSHKISLKAPAALAADVTYTLPGTVTDGYYLQTDASGNLSWAIASNAFDITGDTGTDTVGSGSTLDFAGTADQIVTAVTDQTVTFALTDNVVLVGDLTVGGNDIKMNGGTTALTFSGSGDVAVAGDLKVGGNDILASDGTTAVTLNGADVTVAGDLKVGGNDIKASDDTVAITLSGADVAVAGDLTVTGNDIKMSGGTTALTFSGSGDVAVAGDLTVTGNDIKSSTATAITLDGADVAVAGDLKVGGNDIKASDNTVAITLAGADVTVAGDLQVTGNDIKSSTGATAITLDGANVAIAGDLTVNGTTTTVNSTTVTIDDNLIKLADNNIANTLDTGLYAKYVETATDKFAGLFRDASDSNTFKLFHSLEVEPSTTVDAGHASYVRGTLEANLTGGTISNLASDLAVADGGTGASTFTANGVLFGNGTDPIQVTAAGTNGQVLQVNSSGVPVFGMLDGGTY